MREVLSVTVGKLSTSWGHGEKMDLGGCCPTSSREKLEVKNPVGKIPSGKPKIIIQLLQK